jgi:hypothetical protein
MPSVEQRLTALRADASLRDLIRGTPGADRAVRAYLWSYPHSQQGSELLLSSAIAAAGIAILIGLRLAVNRLSRHWRALDV